MIDTSVLIKELSTLVSNGHLSPETFDHLLTCHKEYISKNKIVSYECIMSEGEKLFQEFLELQLSEPL